MKKTSFLIQAALIAAIYIALTLLLKPFSYDLAQVRISEAMCILPFFTPAAIPGLFVGCALSNLLGSQFSVIDMVVGSLATLMAAYATYKIKNKWLAPLPAVLINALMVGGMLSIMLHVPFYMAAIYVGAGQAISCYALGMPLLYALGRYKDRIFQYN